MEINSSISWKPGLELTSTLFMKLNEAVRERFMALARISNVGACLFPETKLDLTARFVRKNLEMEIHGCRALLPSGGVIEIEECASVPMDAISSDGTYYVCAGQGEQIEFERSGIPLTRPSVRFVVLDMDSLRDSDVLPLVKLVVKDSEVEIDQEYIVPSIAISSDPRFNAWKETVREKIGKLLDHPNLEDGYFSRTLRKYYSFLSVSGSLIRVDAVRFMITDIIDVLDFQFSKDVKFADRMEECDRLDISVWLKGFDENLEQVQTILDNAVPEDNSLDVEALKREIEQSVKTELDAELTDLINARLTEMGDAMHQRLADGLKEYVSGELARTLHDDLHAELDEQLSDKLYRSLYDALYEALFVPEKERDTFMPII